MGGKFHHSMLAALMVVLVAGAASCRGCVKHPSQESEPAVQESARVKKSVAEERMSPRVAEFFARFDNLLGEQQKKREVDEEELEREVTKRMSQKAVNGTIDELLGLDPAAQAERVAQLIDDLRALGDPARDALIDLLGASLPREHRVLVLRALGAFGDETAAKVLYEEALRSSDARSREAALKALRGTKAKDALVAQSLTALKSSAGDDKEKKKGRTETMGQIAVLGTIGGGAVVGELYDIVRTSDDQDARLAAVRAIGDIGGDEARATLDAVMNSDETLRDAAAAALGSMKQEEIVIGFGEILMDRASPVEIRKAAVKGLGHDNSRLARQVLLNVLKDERQPREVHEAAIAVLTNGFGENAETEEISYIALFERTPVEYLPQMMQQLIARGGDYAAAFLDRRYDRLAAEKKVHALRTLGRVGTPKSFKILAERLVNEEDPRLRSEVLSAMSRHDVKKVDDALVRTVENIATDAKDPSERIEALKYVVKLSPGDAVEAAQKNLEGIEEGAVVIASIDVLRAHGGWQSRVSLEALKQKDERKQYAKQIDAALEAIEAREK